LEEKEITAPLDYFMNWPPTGEWYYWPKKKIDIKSKSSFQSPRRHHGIKTLLGPPWLDRFGNICFLVRWAMQWITLSKLRKTSMYKAEFLKLVDISENRKELLE